MIRVIDCSTEIWHNGLTFQGEKKSSIDNVATLYSGKEAQQKFSKRRKNGESTKK